MARLRSHSPEKRTPSRTIRNIFIAAFLAAAPHLPFACSRKPAPPEEAPILPAPKPFAGGTKACIDAFVRFPEGKTFAQRQLYLEHKVLRTLPKEYLLHMGLPTSDVSEIEAESSSRLEKLREKIIAEVERGGLSRPANRWQAKRFFWSVRSVLRHHRFKGQDTLTLGLLENRFDCDTGTSLYLDIGEHFGLPMVIVDRPGSGPKPGHVYAGMKMGGKHVFFETTSGGVVQRTKKTDTVMDAKWSMYAPFLNMAGMYLGAYEHYRGESEYYAQMADLMYGLAMLSSNPENPTALEMFLKSSLKADPAASAECILECLPDSSAIHTANLYRFLGRSYFEMGKGALATQAFEKAFLIYSELECGGESPELYLEWADALKDFCFDSGSPEAGYREEALEKAELGKALCDGGLEEDPGHAGACEGLHNWLPHARRTENLMKSRNLIEIDW